MKPQVSDRSSTKVPFRVFINYRRQESGGYADSLRLALTHRVGDTAAFQDVDSIPLGADWQEKIRQEINDCDVVVAVIGRHWLTIKTNELAAKPRLFEEDDPLRFELRTALEAKRPILPVLVDGAEMPEPSDLPDDIRGLPARNAAYVHRDQPDAGYDRVATAIRDLYDEKVATQRKLVNKARHRIDHGDLATALEAARSIADVTTQVEIWIEIAEAQFKAEKADDAEVTLDLARDAADSVLDDELSDRLYDLIADAEKNTVPPPDLVSETKEKVHQGRLEEARELAEAIEDPAASAEALLVVADADARSRATEKALAMLAFVKKAAERIEEEGARAQVLAEVARVEREVSVDEDADREQRVHELVERAREQVRTGDAADAAATLESVREAARAIEAPERRRAALELPDALERELHGSFAGAEEISGSSGTASRDTAAAAKEPGEPDHAGNPGGSSVWYRWTAPTAGVATIDTVGSDFDTLLAIYRGASVTGLEHVIANDDSEGMQSRVRFPVAEGDEYRIAVDGYGGATGKAVLNWELQPAPPNTGFDAPEQIAGASGTARGDNTGASKEPGEPDHAGNMGGRSLWYRWVAPDEGVATIDTVGSDFDTLLAVYRGSSLAQLESVAANDDTEGTQSRVTFPVKAGEEYRIAVDGYGGSSGTVVLNWETREVIALPDLVRATGLTFLPLPDGSLSIPFDAERAEQVVVHARALMDDVAFLFVELPEFTGFGTGAFLELALKVSYGADYVKAMHLSGDRYALAIEVPLAALTAPVCEGLIRSLVCLGDVKNQADLVGPSWNKRLQSCKSMQQRHIHVDQSRAQAEVAALVTRGELPAGVALHASDNVISLILPMEEVKLGHKNKKDKLRGLLDLNRTADVAKVALDPKGKVLLLYEVPQIVPGLGARVTAQFAALQGQAHTLLD